MRCVSCLEESHKIRTGCHYKYYWGNVIHGIWFPNPISHLDKKGCKQEFSGKCFPVEHTVGWYKIPGTNKINKTLDESQDKP